MKNLNIKEVSFDNRIAIAVMDGWHCVALVGISNENFIECDLWLNEFVGEKNWSYLKFGDAYNFIIYGEEAATAFKLAWL